MPSNLINFWQPCNLTKPPFVHPDDLCHLRKHDGQYIDEEPKDFDTFLSSCRFGNFTDRRFHLSLLPAPYSGNLRAADIVVLMLNPGFSFTDYYGETRVPKFRLRLEQTLVQNFEGTEFPFIGLDPEYCWSAGFCWWEEKLRDVITIIAATKFNGRYLDALCDVSKRLAAVELVPYHSPSFIAHRLITNLPSVKVAVQFAQEVLLKAAKQGDKTVIVTRGAKLWGFREGTRNPIVYPRGLARGASLGRRTPGGKAILERYGISAN